MFKNYFSAHAKDYSRFRPTYPAELFAWLGSIAPRQGCAWDCGTGNGQAARELIKVFDEVRATDGSADQIAQAPQMDGITYSVGTAEDSKLPDDSIDLVCVAQAAHWFNHDAFYKEVKRVCRGQAVVALVAYELFQLKPDVDQIVEDWYRRELDSYWAPERKHIEARYETIPFPFKVIEAPRFEMRLDWNLDHLLGYLRTWSAVKAYARENGSDPVALVADKLTEAWGPRDQERTARWELIVRVGSVG